MIFVFPQTNQFWSVLWRNPDLYPVGSDSGTLHWRDQWGESLAGGSRHPGQPGGGARQADSGLQGHQAAPSLQPPVPPQRHRTGEEKFYFWVTFSIVSSYIRNNYFCYQIKPNLHSFSASPVMDFLSSDWHSLKEGQCWKFTNVGNFIVWLSVWRYFIPEQF